MKRPFQQVFLIRHGERVNRLIEKVRAVQWRVALFAHRHIFRVFAARWLGLPPEADCHFLLDTTTQPESPNA